MNWTIIEVYMENEIVVETRDKFKGDFAYTRASYTLNGVSVRMVEKHMEALVTHIAYVREAGKQLGVPMRQLAEHDASKFDPEEFIPYARHFHGGGDTKAFSRAWLHHIHHNPHHWQHWIFPDGYTPKGSGVENGVMYMPESYALEMIADWMGASMAYTGSWDMTEWLGKNMGKIRLHSETAIFIREKLGELGYGDVVEAHCWAHEGKT